MFIFDNLHIKYFNPSIDKTNYRKKERIYHYTSASGLYGIIKNSKIRFTDCQFVNDKSEYTHIIIPLQNAFDEIKKDLHNDFKNDVKTILFHLENHDFETNDISIDQINPLTFGETRKRNYVFCASTEPDLLGLWNYYVKSGNYQGYNLGFNINKFLDCFSIIKNRDVNVYYGKVVYNNRKKIDILKDLLSKANMEFENKKREKANEEYETIRQEIINNLLEYIQDYRLFFKDEAFTNEKEFRFIIKMPFHYKRIKIDPLEMNYEVRNGIITPYCELPISKDKTIELITLSPMMESELAILGVRRFLEHNEFNFTIDIRQSRIPIRY